MADFSTRSLYNQALTGTSTWDILFTAGSGSSGSALRGVSLSCATQDVDVIISGITDQGTPTTGVPAAGGDHVAVRLKAGDPPVPFYAMNGQIGLISQIQAKPAVAGGTVTMRPILA